MKYVLDFDRVLYNFDAYLAAVEERGLRDLFFDPHIWDILKVRDYLYDDAIPYMKTKEQHDLVVISAMTPAYGPLAREYQKRKLQDAHMEEFVSEVVVMEGDKAPYVCPYVGQDTLVFLDDKLDHLESVRRICPSVHCVQMVRAGSSLESGVSTSPDIPVIGTLAELDAIIKNIQL